MEKLNGDVDAPPQAYSNTSTSSERTGLASPFNMRRTCSVVWRLKVGSPQRKHTLAGMSSTKIRLPCTTNTSLTLFCWALFDPHTWQWNTMILTSVERNQSIRSRHSLTSFAHWPTRPKSTSAETSTDESTTTANYTTPVFLCRVARVRFIGCLTKRSFP